MSDKIETNDLRGGLTHRVTPDPYRAKKKEEETASLKGGLTFGTSCGPYDGRQEVRDQKSSAPAALDFFGDAIQPAQHSSRLATEFFYPPFSVLNARDGWWQERKREWLALGIQSELGRGEGAEPGGSKQPTINPLTGKICRADSKGRPIQGTDAGEEKRKRKANAIPGGSGKFGSNTIAVNHDPDFYRNGRGKTKAAKEEAEPPPPPPPPPTGPRVFGFKKAAK